ncbi:MAG: hypothetical protein IJF41_06990 [Clostridia bacterium]|nr:hypothetical protein [Clostridia bacterium]
MGTGKRKHKQKVYELLDLPRDADLVTPRITLSGNEILLVENNQEAVTCTERQVRLMTNLGILSIEGRDLELKEFMEGRAVIRGRITGLAFETAEEG